MRAGADARPRTAGPDASARPAVAAVHEHITDAVKTPDLIRLTGDTVLARFETMKVYAALGAVRSLL
ncbi:cysteine synthase family protein, partial [Streptomyces sp. SID7499]|nr:cysteine synthase family protein [Streptomyces sp. SID7499]